MLLNDSNVTIANIYGPNEDDPIFYQRFKIKIEEFENSQIILAGVVQSYMLDVFNIQNRNNQNVA
jgi:hypothetical protein